MEPLENLVLPEGLFDPVPSIADSVQLHLPILVTKKTSESTAIIVDGCKRYFFAKNNNVKTIPCLTLSESISQEVFCMLRISCNQGRTLSIKEKLLFISWLNTNKGSTSLNDVARQAGLDTADVLTLAPVLALDQETISAVADGLIHPQVSPLYACLTPEDRLLYAETFKKENLSLQSQREFLEWLPEIASRENTSIESILKNPAIVEVISSEKLNIPQKTEKIRTYLFSRRFPRLLALKKSWESSCKKNNPDASNITFIQNPSFEFNRLEVKIKCTSASKATELFKTLADFPAATWNELINPVSKE
jgi:ParB-like chromosome segregation protein Spo0J